MPWKEVTAMSSKLDFVQLALTGSIAFSELCRRFNVSRKTGYKLLARYKEGGTAGLKDRPRKPVHSPKKTHSIIEDQVLAIRKKKPTWGCRKIHNFLINNNSHFIVPAKSTINDILLRHGLIDNRTSKQSNKFIRFEHEAPNDLWQADFKGNFETHRERCHPLTVLDDHSRFCLAIKACLNQKGATVKGNFIKLFEEYGLPLRINFDNGNPWGSSHNRTFRFTEFSIWLLRLGIHVSFSRPNHPETNGKIERFHRSLKEDVLNFNYFLDIKEAQNQFDIWRQEYNYERPHEGIGMKPPIARYVMSKRAYEEKLPDIEYRDSDIIRTVNSCGYISFKGQKYFISESLKGLPVGIRTNQQGVNEVYFLHQKIDCID